MLLAMFVARTTDLFSQSMNKRTEETPQSVIANVHKAAQLLKEKGSEALAVLTDPKSEFNDRYAYLFIIDVDKSLVVSNPRFPERTGGNIREHLDWSGKHYGVELCEVAMRGGGWIEFVWPKPERAYARCPISTRFRASTPTASVERLQPIPMNILVSIDVWSNFSHTESRRSPI